ncbi:hypothetical protein AAG594_02765 [Citromicrobium bathyomarinum]
MSLFPETIRRYAAGGKVEAATLVSMHFASETWRLWGGLDVLETNDDNRWHGLGTLGSITGLQQATDGRAPEATMTLSGVTPKVIKMARDDFATEARNRLVRVWLQFFGVDDPEDPDNQRCLDNPFPIWAGRMLRPGFTFDRGDDEEPEESTVSVTLESIFTSRSRPNFALCTDSDQQGRFPGDKGFQFAATLRNKVLTWPDY